MIKKSPLVRITCLVNEKPEKIYEQPFQMRNLSENGNSELLEKTIEGCGVLGRSSVKPRKRRSQPIDIDKFIHDKTRERAIPYNLKTKILINSGINAYMKYCKINGILPDPQKVLTLLYSIKGVKIMEEEFVNLPKRRIQHGRKFNVVVNKNLKMIFEVHDYKDDDGQVYWRMRLYDDDKNKNSSSYLNQSGSFNRNVYKDENTHISCGENGRRFVMGK